MTLTEAIVSGLVQGVTEFLPISSSGHLVFIHRLFGFSEPAVFFDICLHAATLAAVIIYFSRDIAALVRERNWKWLFYIIIATIPAVLTAVIFEDRISSFFVNPVKVAMMLVVTGVILFVGQFSLSKRNDGGAPPTFSSSLIVGIAQAFALFPGISRSGATISAGLAGGMNKENAFRFSFLISIPAIIGAVLYKGLTIDIGAVIKGNVLNYAAGMAVAFAVGFLCLHILWSFIRKNRLYVFGGYCILLGSIYMIFLR
jgi:undecaprenyl-diphosphatase